MITRDDYFMGRDITHKSEMTPEISSNAGRTIERVNKLLAFFGESRKVTSGWRPPSLNAKVPGAAKRSNHMIGAACDLEDEDGDLDEWCMDNLNVLEMIGLWLEHPASTKNWTHIQIFGPRSGKRGFYP